MATENPSTDNVDLRLLGRQVSDIRLRLGNLEGRVGMLERDTKVLIVMAQNQDEAMKDLNRQLGEVLAAIIRIEHRLDGER